MIHGSSPLARGLPDVREPQRQPQWIIPARAGFTRGSSSPGGTVGDHPRSRGVYGQTSPCSEGGHGSSPLARGLHLEHGMGGRLRRIIPARAGFTPPVCSDTGYPGDHPRSRGVYVAAAWAQTKAAGSSPLARGLLGEQFAEGAGLGIIPARAGFTSDASSPDSVTRDHPRSRGVYVAPPVGPVRGRGIIPARAGFTS